VKIGSQISYEDEYIIIIGKIMQGGFIQIQPKECRIKMEKQPEAISKYPNITDLIFKTWPNSNDSCQYPTRIALIKEMTNSKSLHRQEEYIARFR